MIRSLTMLTAIAALAFSLVASDSEPSRDEIWIDANHLKVFVNGEWEDIKLAPIAQSTCQQRHHLFDRYCE